MVLLGVLASRLLKMNIKCSSVIKCKTLKNLEYFLMYVWFYLHLSTKQKCVRGHCESK